MEEFLQQVVSGLASGGIFASLALALVLIYRATGVVNFAQGEMAMFTTFVAWSLMEHLPYWPAFALTLVAAFVGGAVIELTLIRPVQSASPLTVVIEELERLWTIAAPYISQTFVTVEMLGST